MLEASLKIIAKILLLVLGWPIGIVILKLISLGRARRLIDDNVKDEELVSAYWLFQRNEDEELFFSDITAAWIGAASILIFVWGVNGFELPWG